MTNFIQFSSFNLPQSRSFECLAASRIQYTASPGDNSFTSALIWALKELASVKKPSKESFTPMFTTSKLVQTIHFAPNFPKDQMPQLNTRDTAGLKHIVLAPLLAQGDSGVGTDNEDGHDLISTTQCLNLTFYFKSKLDDKNLRKFADHLKIVMKLDEGSLVKVQWGGTWSVSKISAGDKFRHLVTRVIKTTSRRNRVSDLASRQAGIEEMHPVMQHTSHSDQDGQPNSAKDGQSLDNPKPKNTDKGTWSGIRTKCISFLQLSWKSSRTEQQQTRTNHTLSNCQQQVKTARSCYGMHLQHFFQTRMFHYTLHLLLILLSFLLGSCILTVDGQWGFDLIRSLYIFAR
jgi:hypothetical protein